MQLISLRTANLTPKENSSYLLVFEGSGSLESN
jgi:hypothetical protein